MHVTCCTFPNVTNLAVPTQNLAWRKFEKILRQGRWDLAVMMEVGIASCGSNDPSPSMAKQLQEQFLVMITVTANHLHPLGMKFGQSRRLGGNC